MAGQLWIAGAEEPESEEHLYLSCLPCCCSVCADTEARRPAVFAQGVFREPRAMNNDTFRQPVLLPPGELCRMEEQRQRAGERITSVFIAQVRASARRQYDTSRMRFTKAILQLNIYFTAFTLRHNLMNGDPHLQPITRLCSTTTLPLLYY